MCKGSQGPIERSRCCATVFVEALPDYVVLVNINLCVLKIVDGRTRSYNGTLHAWHDHAMTRGFCWELALVLLLPLFVLVSLC